MLLRINFYNFVARPTIQKSKFFPFFPPYMKLMYWHHEYLRTVSEYILRSSLHEPYLIHLNTNIRNIWGHNIHTSSDHHWINHFEYSKIMMVLLTLKKSNYNTSYDYYLRYLKLMYWHHEYLMSVSEYYSQIITAWAILI